MKIKKGDTILVTTGKDGGKKGKILQAFPLLNKIIVENINLKKKKIKAKSTGQKGQIIEFPARLNVSNVKLICPKCSKASRVGYIINKENKKRICKKCKQEI